MKRQLPLDAATRLYPSVFAGSQRLWTDGCRMEVAEGRLSPQIPHLSGQEHCFLPGLCCIAQDEAMREQPWTTQRHHATGVAVMRPDDLATAQPSRRGRRAQSPGLQRTFSRLSLVKPQ